MLRHVLHLTTIAFALTALQSVRADVKLRPGDKPKESTKDFMKDKEKNGYPTPEPHDRTANFVSGGSVVIDLDVATSYLGSVKFTIKDQPQHGTLSAITSHPSSETNKAQVTYTHNGDATQLNDRFTFQAKIADGNTSAPGVITLVGRPAMPALVISEAARFPRVQPGQTQSARVVVTNLGTAPFSGDLKWKAPFSGPPHLDVPVNEKAEFLVVFKSEVPGGYRLDQELQPGVAASHVQAFVECILPFTATPGSITLAYDPAHSARSGTVKVSNGSASPMTLRVEAPARLQVAKEINLPAGESQDLVIGLDAADVDAFRGEVWVIQEPAREKIVVLAEAEPAQIKLAAPADAKIDFGKVEKGKPGEASLTLTNQGGQLLIAKVLSLPAPFLFAESPDNASIEPGKSATFKLKFAPEQPGEYSNTLSIGGNGGNVSIALRGSFVDAKRAPVTAGATSGNPHAPPRQRDVDAAPKRESVSTPASAPPPVPPPSVPASLKYVQPVPAPSASQPPVAAASPQSKPGIEDKPPGPNAVDALRTAPADGLKLQSLLSSYGFGLESLPMFQSKILDRVPAIGLKDAGRDYIELAWQLPKVEPKQFIVQTAVLIRNEKTGLPIKGWKNVENWQPVARMPAGTAGARIDGLQPGAEYEWRVIGMDSEGKLSQASDILRTAMPAITRTPLWVWSLIGGAVLMASVVIMRRVRAQKALGI